MIEHWGTPASVSLIEDETPLPATYWVRLDKKNMQFLWFHDSVILIKAPYDLGYQTP